jgi:hypothetical protein
MAKPPRPMARVPLKSTDALTVRQDGEARTATVGDLPQPAAIDMQAALAAYFANTPPVSAQALAAAVATYLQASPPAPGRPPTAAEIKAAVDAWFVANPMRRIELITGVAGTEITFATPFAAAAPIVIPIMGWLANDQLVIPTVASVSKTKLLLNAKRSRGTLVLTTGPFENATAGTAVSAVVIGV